MSVRDHVAIYLDNISRTRVLQVVCGVCALRSARAQERFRGPADRPTRRARYRRQRSRRRRRCELEPGTYLIEAREQTIDLHVSVDSAAGARAEIEDRDPASRRFMRK